LSLATLDSSLEEMVKFINWVMAFWA